MRVRALVLLVSVSACAVRHGATPPGHDEQQERVRFDRLEDEIVRDLASIDMRIAERARVTPSEEDLRRVAMAAVLEEDPTIAIVDGRVDPFSFDARARGLESARRKIRLLPLDHSNPNERELLARLVEEEIARLDEERSLPLSASSLVRAIVDTWQPPTSELEAADRDRWLARRIAGIRETMTAPIEPASLDVVRARELDDALDALERIASSPGFTKSTRELVLVRAALEDAASKPAAKARSDWTVISVRAKTHLGVSEPPEELARQLESLEADLRTKAEQAIASAHVDHDAVAAALDKQTFVAGTCLDAVPGSRVRSMAAPEERRPACHLRHDVSRAEGDSARAVALATMHDHVVVAEWALDVARGISTIAQAQSKHHLFMPVSPDTRARYERIALVRPVAAIGAGEATRILVAGDPTARAVAWSTLGDVPFDVARRHLAHE